MVRRKDGTVLSCIATKKQLDDTKRLKKMIEKNNKALVKKNSK